MHRLPCFDTGQPWYPPSKCMNLGVMVGLEMAALEVLVGLEGQDCFHESAWPYSCPLLAPRANMIHSCCSNGSTASLVTATTS